MTALAPAAQADPVSLGGTVTADDTGAPVPNACVSVYEEFLAGWAGSACTDDAGHYTVEGLTAGTRYVVQVDNAGEYVGEWAQDAADSTGATVVTAPATVDVGLAHGVTLSGTVRTSDGAPADGAGVSAQGADGAGWFSGSTGADGTYSMFVRPGDYRISFSLADGTSWFAYGTTDFDAATIVHVSAGTPAVVDDTAPKPTVVTGRVTDAGTGAPLAGICVSAADPADLSTRQDGGPGACTQEDGRYTLSPVTPGTWVAMALDATGAYAYALSAPFTLAQGQSTTADLAMPRAGAVSGTVVDRVTGRPLEGICPDVSTGRTGDAVWGQVATCSDAAGRWAVSGLRPEKVTVHLSGDDTHVGRWALDAATRGAADLYRVTSGRTTAVGKVRLLRGGTLSGRITDTAGKPVDGAWVLFGGVFASRAGAGEGRYTARTGADGRYTIANIEPSSQPAEVYTEAGTGYAWQFSGRAADVSTATKLTIAADRTTTFNAALQPEATLRVDVTGTAGRSAMLDARTASGAPIGWSTDAVDDGSFVITGLPTSKVKLQISVPGETDADPTVIWYDGASSAATATPIRVTSGRQTVVAVALPQ